MKVKLIIANTAFQGECYQCYNVTPTYFENYSEFEEIKHEDLSKLEAFIHSFNHKYKQDGRFAFLS